MNFNYLVIKLALIAIAIATYDASHALRRCKAQAVPILAP